MSYQRELFRRYHTTHVSVRKGADSPASLATRGRILDKTWGHLLPANRDARILDAACGNGALLWWLSRRGYRDLTGTDISAEVIAEGSRLGIEGLTVADFREHLPTASGGYDVIVLRDVLEHFPKDETLGVLDEVRRGLRPGGRLLLQVPNGDSPMFARVRYGDFTHETAFTASSLSQVLLVTGFEALEFWPSGPVATSFRSRPRIALFKAVQVLYKVLAWSETGVWPAVVTQNVICVARVGQSTVNPPSTTSS